MYNLGAPVQLFPQHFVVVVAAHADQVHGAAGGAHAHNVAELEVDRHLAVEGEHDGFFAPAPLGFKFNGDLAVVGDDDRAHTELDGTERSEHKALYFWMNNGAAGGERVSRRARRGRDNESVGLVVRELALVHLHAQANEARKAALVDHRVVEREVGVPFFSVAIDGDAQQDAFIGAYLACKNFGKTFDDALRGEGREKAKISHVDPGDHEFFLAEAARGFEEGAISAKNYYELCFAEDGSFFVTCFCAHHRCGIFIKKNIVAVFFERRHERFQILCAFFNIVLGDDADFFDGRYSGYQASVPHTYLWLKNNSDCIVIFIRFLNYILRVCHKAHIGRIC